MTRQSEGIESGNSEPDGTLETRHGRQDPQLRLSPGADRGVSWTARPKGCPHLPSSCAGKAPARLHRSPRRPTRSVGRSIKTSRKTGTFCRPLTRPLSHAAAWQTARLTPCASRTWSLPTGVRELAKWPTGQADNLLAFICPAFPYRSRPAPPMD